jgi:hypothetical protein
MTEEKIQSWPAAISAKASHPSPGPGQALDLDRFSCRWLWRAQTQISAAQRGDGARRRLSARRMTAATVGGVDTGTTPV